MKKVLALVLSVLMVLSLSVVAFADEVEKPNTTPGTSVDNDPDTSYDLGFGDLGKPEGSEPDKPGATYYYTIMDKNDDSGMLTSDEIAKHLTVSIKESGDKMIDSYSIVKQNGVYKVKVVTKETFTTEETEATWTAWCSGRRRKRSAAARGPVRYCAYGFDQTVKSGVHPTHQLVHVGFHAVPDEFQSDAQKGKAAEIGNAANRFSVQPGELIQHKRQIFPACRHALTPFSGSAPERNRRSDSRSETGLHKTPPSC